MTTKENAVRRTAGQLRLSESAVRNVVDEYEKNRSAINRETSKSTSSKKKTSPSKSAPKALGNGWYLMPDGSKAHGKKAAGLS
jgi:hypothetical protein